MSAKRVTVAQLKALLASIGSPLDGAKPVLQARLAKDLKIPRLPTSIADSKCTSGSTKKEPKATRILSIDMGIKNLAFCVADVNLAFNPQAKNPCPKGHITTIAWRRMDVAQEIERLSPDALRPGSDTEAAPDYFSHPRNLSSIAHALLTRILLPYAPDIILIERQRYRSGGGSAILEWTLRVNMLEGMLWATLKTLRESNRSSSAKDQFPEVFDVVPRRVGMLWMEAPNAVGVRRKLAAVGEGGLINVEEKDVLVRGKIDKQQKIKLVRSWLSTSPFSSQSPESITSKMEPSVSLTFSFSDEAEETRRALCSASKPKQRKAKTRIPVAGNPRKLDDLADCFLQAAAWVTWEGGRLKIVHDGEAEIIDETETKGPHATAKKSRRKAKTAASKAKELEIEDPDATVKKSKRNTNSPISKGKEPKTKKLDVTAEKSISNAKLPTSKNSPTRKSKS